MHRVSKHLNILLAVGYLAVTLHSIGKADIVGDDEAREVGIVQDIVQGQWLWPRFNGETLPDKPLLFHWLAAVPCLLAGFSTAIVRSPSAVAASLLIGWMASFGREMFGAATGGLVAATLLATMPALFEHACVARPDALLVLLLSVALGWAFRWWRDGQRHDATAVLTLLGLATLAKGPVAPVLFCLSFGGFLLWQQELGRLRSLFTGPGVFALLVLGGGWYVAALAGWGELFVQEHLVGRYVGNTVGGLVSGGRYSPHSLWHHLFFYPIHVLLLALPWAPFFVLGLWREWGTARFQDPRQRFLLCWALAPVITFTPAAYKLRYYVLPSLPAIALLTAPTVAALLNQPRCRPTLRRTVVVCVSGLVLITAAWVVVQNPMLLWPSDRQNLALALSLFPAGAWGALAAYSLGVTLVTGSVLLRAWRLLVGGLTVVSIAWLTLGSPLLDAQRNRHESLHPFADAVAARSLASVPLVFYKMESRPIIVYLGQRIPILWRAEALSPPMLVIVKAQDYEELAAAGRLGAPLLSAEGRVGNLEQSRVVLAEVTEELGSKDHVSENQREGSE